VVARSEVMATKVKAIGQREIKGIGPNQIVWEEALTGFGIRRQKEKVVYFVKYRYLRKQRWHSIGRSDQFEPGEARTRAREILQKVRDGIDPQKIQSRGISVSELCDKYIVDAAEGRLPVGRLRRPKKVSTLVSDRSRIESHIKPLLGDFAVGSVSRLQVDQFLLDVADGKTGSHLRPKAVGGKGTATRTLGLLGAIFGYAVGLGLRSDSPVKGVARFEGSPRERRLSEEEYAILGECLRLAEGDPTGVWPPAVAAMRFMALTGFRKGEVLGLKWSEIDFGLRAAQLADDTTGRSVKTRRSVRPLSKVAVEVLETMKNRPYSDDRLVFPSVNRKVMAGFPGYWKRIVGDRLPADINRHVLRHSLGSVAADIRVPEAMVGGLLGHKKHSVTAGYMHIGWKVLLEVADAVADRIVGLMGDGSPEARVVPIR
jgi:site-specific recombinase XerC